jgi:cysteine desulfurase
MSIGGNPSSVHGPGRAARAAVEDGRARVATLVGVSPESVVFTSGGTEANNLALTGCDRGGVIVSAIEHPSVLSVRPDATVVGVGLDGVVDLAALEQALDGGEAPALVSVMMANNETGVLQPMDEVVRLAQARGALVHTDAVQAAGRVAIDMADLGVDLLTLSAHKIGGPQGVGALVVRDHVKLQPLLRGGGQERRRRAGTENVAGIVGFGVAADRAGADLAGIRRLTAMRDELETRIARDAIIHGASAARIGTTSCVGMPGVSGETQVMAFDLAGIAISAGAACSSGKVEASHVLRAMGVEGNAAGEAVRISFGYTSAMADVDAVVAVWEALHRRTRRDGVTKQVMAAVGAAA